MNKGHKELLLIYTIGVVAAGIAGYNIRKMVEFRRQDKASNNSESFQARKTSSQPYQETTMGFNAQLR